MREIPVIEAGAGLECGGRGTERLALPCRERPLLVGHRSTGEKPGEVKAL